MLADLTPAQVPSDPPLMLVDLTPAQISSDPLPIVVDPCHGDPTSQSVVPTPALVASDCPPILIVSGVNPQSEGDFIAADAVTTLDELLYYRYGFSLKE